jgi:hypothetical protein
MAEPDPYADPYASPAPVTVQAPPQDYGNPSAYAPMLERHQTAFNEREKERQQIEAKQQLNTDQMSTLLEDAAKTIRKSREGRSNLPMIALGAGMMGTPGDFGTQVGAGLRAMVPQIQKQREDEDKTELTLAELGTKAGEIRNMPLKTKLDYLKAIQLGDIATIRAIETAQVRAQAQQGNKSGTLDLNTQKAHAAVMQKASAEAFKQLQELNKDNDYTQEEMQKVYSDLLKQQITLQAGASGMQLNDEYVNKALQAQMPGMGVASNQFPNLADMKAEGEKEGLPAMPPTYDTMGAKDRSKQRLKEAEAYRKESTKWDEQAGTDKTMDNDLREAQAIIQANPDLIGKIKGRGWNISPEADRLAKILARLETTSVPKGQGQITDFERRLFKEALPTMTSNPEAALRTLQVMRDANNRSSEQRAFMDKYYRTYRTLEGANTKWEEYMKSPTGSYVTEQGGKLVPNADRMSSDIYFKWQRMGSPEVRRGPNGEWMVRRDGKVEVLK